ncbi:hypothetical protein ASD58_29060 [Duganella sp. Root1480D1]|nr:hypothetical protein ASD58_29060 [Duganella sp. Root1480D1]
MDYQYRALSSRREIGRGMKRKPELRSWSAKQAVAILAVDNIQVSDHALDLLKGIEDGLITHEQAKEEILRRAKAMALNAKK